MFALMMTADEIKLQPLGRTTHVHIPLRITICRTQVVFNYTNEFDRKLNKVKNILFYCELLF